MERRKKKIWRVKCPRCKKYWKYRDDRLIAGPMYKYCKACSKVEAETGTSVSRGTFHPPRPFESAEE